MAQRPGGKDSSSEDVNSHLISLPRSFPPPPPSLFVGDLWCYISFPLVHPLPTFVNHPCPYLSARPIGHSFWCSVSYCGPNRTVQGSLPHKWGQGVSCGYLIWRWQLLLEFLFYYAPMASPFGTYFGMLEGTAFSDVALSPSMILVCQRQSHPRQYILAVWIPFVCPQTFLPTRHGPWAWYEMGRSPQILWPHSNVFSDWFYF